MALTLSACCGSDDRQKPERGSATRPTMKSGLVPPAGWQPLPQLAKAARDAITDVTVDGAEAWGETTRGCYAAWLAVHGGGAAAGDMADQVIKSVTTELPGIQLRDVVKPAADADRGVLALAFERGSYHGKLRAQLASSGMIIAFTCYWNQREPAVCDQACTQLIGSLR